MVKFEWDEKKNLSNQKKHGIAFEDAIFVFSDSEHLSIPDLDIFNPQRGKNEKTIYIPIIQILLTFFICY